ncbi:hypothetical protein BVX99_02865, partial [bacterium F16]
SQGILSPNFLYYQDITAFRKVFAGVSVAIGLTSLLIMAWLLSRITRPIVKLTEATAQVAEGNLNQEIDVENDDEIGVLARRFIEMRAAIKVRINELNKEIVERRKAEKDSAVFQSALTASTDAIGMSTPDGVHYYQNEAFDRMLGTIGGDPTQTVYVDKRVGQEVFKTIMGGGRWEGEVKMYAADGHILDILLRAYALNDEDGTVTHLIGVHTDITDSKRAAEALEKRIIALTQPLVSDEGIGFDDLFNLQDVQTLQDEFSRATRVASVITDVDGHPITEPSKVSPHCFELMGGTENGLATCFNSSAELNSMTSAGTVIQPSIHGGLWNAGAAIAVGGKHIANWLIGQVRDDGVNDESIKGFAHELGVDEDEALRHFCDVPVMSKETFGHVAQALFTLARQLSTSAYQNVQQARFISERKTAEGDLKRSEENLRTTLNSIGDAVISTNRDGRINSMNPVAESLTGWSYDDANDKPLNQVFKIVRAGSRETLNNPVQDVLSSGEVVASDDPIILIANNSKEYHIAESAAPIRDDAGDIQGVVLVFRDITAELEMQEQLRHSQKMDAIGQLAGGVAHDFNNMLGGILGSAELLKIKLTDKACLPMVDIIIESAERASGLTHKLLAFARKEPTLMQPVNAEAVIEDSVALLRRTIDRRISVELELAPGTHVVNGDLTLLQNLFLNLGINASHAMPEGGIVKIVSSIVELDEKTCKTRSFDLTAGHYFKVVVQDTGSGISKDDLPRVFEPFFTTKGAGKGTGLGLAAVYGTVQQHGGAGNVENGLGGGTTFGVLLPI